VPSWSLLYFSRLPRWAEEESVDGTSIGQLLLVGDVRWSGGNPQRAVSHHQGMNWKS
jgi:hypothetical protein